MYTEEQLKYIKTMTPQEIVDGIQTLITKAKESNDYSKLSKQLLSSSFMLDICLNKN
jgi:hypothetical protein